MHVVNLNLNQNGLIFKLELNYISVDYSSVALFLFTFFLRFVLKGGKKKQLKYTEHFYVKTLLKKKKKDTKMACPNIQVKGTNSVFNWI